MALLSLRAMRSIMREWEQDDPRPVGFVAGPQAVLAIERAVYSDRTLRLGFDSGPEGGVSIGTEPDPDTGMSVRLPVAVAWGGMPIEVSAAVSEHVVCVRYSDGNIEPIGEFR